MKKIIAVALAVLLLPSVVWAGEIREKRDIDLSQKGTCKGTSDLKLRFRYDFPGGFLSWGSTDGAEGWGANPILVQFGQIQEIELELIKEGEGGFLDFLPLERGKDWWESACGHLVIKTKVCMPAGTVVQVLVRGIFDREYRLAVDESFGFFGFGKGCGFSQLSDGTWGIACQ